MPTSLINQAIINQYTYNRWKKIVNIMILKELNNYKIHRLRVIHIYEHDYNLVLGIKWRELIHTCCCNNLLNKFQYGGVPGRDAIFRTIIEELQYKITRASKRPLIHMDYGATACYDRIIPAFSSLASQSFGQHKNIVHFNASNLHSSQYLLHTPWRFPTILLSQSR